MIPDSRTNLELAAGPGTRQEPPRTGRERLASIDTFRGLAILLMVLANFMGGVHLIPAWLKHAPDIGLTGIDLIAPLFIFAIGLTYRGSFQRRLARKGAGKTIRHFVLRFGVLIAIGAAISLGENIFGADSRWVIWGVLAAIGAAGLVALPTLLLGTFARLALGLGMLLAYQLLLDRFWLSGVLGSPHGGIPGAISWSAMLVLATVLADLFHDRRWGHQIYPAAGALFLAAGAALALLVPVSKNRVSASYVLISLGVSALLFYAVHLASRRTARRDTLLTAWGKNPLALYLLHQLLLGVFFLPGIPGWYAEAPLGLTFLQAGGLLAALSAAGLAWQRRGWVWSL